MSIYKSPDRLPTAIAAGPRQFAGWLESVREGDTRVAAHKSIQPHRSHLQRIVLQHIERMGPSTVDAIEYRTGMSHQTASARVSELRNAGVIYDTGSRSLTRSGRKAVLWAIRK